MMWELPDGSSVSQLEWIPRDTRYKEQLAIGNHPSNLAKTIRQLYTLLTSLKICHDTFD